MAEDERLTKKERRERAREERKRKEQEAERRRQRSQLKGGLITFAIVAVVAAVLLQAFMGGTASIDEPILLASDEAQAARDAAGCEVLTERQPLADSSHMENSPGLDLSQLYTDVRPTHSGPHTPSVHPVDAFDRQIDEFNSTHNLEHGSVIVWWDPAQVDAGGEIESWVETLNASGFSTSQMRQGGVGIIASQYEDPGISSGKGVAFRAWGTAMDCDEWDETVANSFVIDHFGTHGIGPESNAAPYPEDVLAYDDADGGDAGADEADGGDAGADEADGDGTQDAEGDDEGSSGQSD